MVNQYTPNQRWDADAVEELRRCWAAGHTAGQIARRLGGGITRNAVIGKVHRLGIASRSMGLHKKPATRSKPWTPVPPGPGRVRQRAVPPVAPEEVCDIRPDNPPAVESERKTLLFRNALGHLEADDRLTSACCRWPIGDPKHADFHFCGKVKAAGLPYCGAHAERAYAPSIPPQPPRTAAPLYRINGRRNREYA